MLVDKVQNKLEHWKNKALTRTRLTIQKTEGNQVVVNSLSCINFCNNDYLALAKHPKIMEAYLNGIQQYGLGSGASSVVSGYYSAQHELETRFAEWLGVESAILFSSGYLANLGVIGALADRSSTVFSDKLSHASILDGIQLSRAKHYRYRHGCVTDLARLAKLKRPDYIISESVFSMEGTIAPVNEIITTANQYQASTIIDDAHGIGVLGEQGGGICEYAKLDSRQLACLITPLGKAFNAMGAIVAGRSEIIEAILQFARSYRYSTALPPAICVALLTTLDVVRASRWRREKLAEIIQFFTENALARGFKLSSTETTPIKSIIIGDSLKVLELQQDLLSKGFLISCIRPPTVAHNTARVRICLNCDHTQDQIRTLLDHMSNSLLR